ncbi:protein kinase 4 [Calliphora vicina]|uniref:protein kinase 4 n=1 Tax=Calliphora vicina TaxID=7373 RepID=UPI00325B56E9
MLNMRNQLDKIIITAMDRFVWFVLLVVMSHLVTEFTRVTGYTRGPRQDVVMVNDSSIQPIRVQNLVLYPGQEYGLYEQQNQQYYNGNNRYNNYANSDKQHNTNNNNFLSSLFNQFTNNNNNQQPQQPNSGNSNNILNVPADQGDVRTFSFRPIIDSIFEIPISTLRAVNNLVGRLTGGYQQPQQQDQQHHQLLPQQQPPKYSSYPSYPASASAQSSSSYYGMQKSAGTIEPKTQFEMLNRIRQTSETPAAATQNAAPVQQAEIRKSSLNNGLQQH